MNEDEPTERGGVGEGRTGLLFMAKWNVGKGPATQR